METAKEHTTCASTIWMRCDALCTLHIQNETDKLNVWHIAFQMCMTTAHFGRTAQTEWFSVRH